jgi:hypothetical protein
MKTLGISSGTQEAQKLQNANLMGKNVDIHCIRVSMVHIVYIVGILHYSKLFWRSPVSSSLCLQCLEHQDDSLLMSWRLAQHQRLISLGLMAHQSLSRREVALHSDVSVSKSSNYCVCSGGS